MAKPCQLPSPDGCQERFLGTHEDLDQAPHIVIGLVLSVRDAEHFPQALGLERLDLFFVVSQQCPCLTSVKQDGYNQLPKELKFGLEFDVTFPYPV